MHGALKYGVFQRMFNFERPDALDGKVVGVGENFGLKPNPCSLFPVPCSLLFDQPSP